MSNKTINYNMIKKYFNDTNVENNLNNLDYEYLIMISFIKNIISIIILILLFIIKYFKIYNYYFNEQNNQHIIILNCFTGGFFFYFSFLFAVNRTFYNNYKKDNQLINNNINNLEIYSFIFGFIFIFFIKKILTYSISFYIPLNIPEEITKIEKNYSDSNNNIKKYNPNNNNNTSEINESGLLSLNNIIENSFKNNKIYSFNQKQRKYNNIEMRIIEKNENELDLKIEENKKEFSSNNNNIQVQFRNNYILNRPFKDADNDEETNEELILNLNEKKGKKLSTKKRSFIRGKNLLINQIPNFNLNASKVKKNEKVKEENIHKMGTKINKEVFDIIYKNKNDIKNEIITYNLCNKNLFKLIISIFFYNIYILLIGLLIGIFDLKQDILMFVSLILLTYIRVLYEKYNLLYNYDLFKNEPIIQKVILIIIDFLFPIGIFLGNKLINIYYKTNSLQFCNFIIFIKGVCSGNLLYCGIFLLYFEENKNNFDIKNKFMFFSIGIIISFIIISIKY